MVDENKFFNLGNLNDKIAYALKNGKFEKKDFAGDNKLLQIFNFFDKDGNGVIESSNSKGVNEIASLWNTVKSSANKNGNSIFEAKEAQDLLTSSIDSTGKTLAENDVKDVDLIGFFKKILNPTKLESEIIEYSKLYEQSQESSVEYLVNNVKTAQKMLEEQLKEQGIIGNGVNLGKELSDKDLALSKIYRALMNEDLCDDLLRRAHNNNLSEKDYLEAKLDLAIRMLPALENSETKSKVFKQVITLGLYKATGNMTKSEEERITKECEIAYLKEALKKLTPEQLTLFIENIVSLSEEEYLEQAPELVDKMINKTIEEKGLEYQTQNQITDGSQKPKLINNNQTIERKLENRDVNKLMSFGEIFERERGIIYNPHAIVDHATKEFQYKTLTLLKDRYEVAKTNLKSATASVKGNMTYSGNQEQTVACDQQLATQLEKTLKDLYGNDATEIKELIKEILGDTSGIDIKTDEQGNLVSINFNVGSNLPFELVLDEQGQTIIKENTPDMIFNGNVPLGIGSYQLVQLSNGIQSKLEQEYQNALEGKTLEYYQQESKKAYQKAYGDKNAQEIVYDFIQSQQQGIANVELTLNILSTALMLVPGGAAATSSWLLKGAIGLKAAKGVDFILTAQKLVNGAAKLQKAAQVASPVIMANMTLRPTELVEQLSSKNGMSAEEWEAWGQGVLQNTTYMAVGMGVGKLAETATAMYKTKALVKTLKDAGKSFDEIQAIIKANPVKFPNEIVKSFSKTDNLAKALQVSSEVALDIATSIVLDKAMGHETLPQDIINSILFAINGTVLQKQFMPLSKPDKIDFLMNAFKDYGINERDAYRILEKMDEISKGGKAKTNVDRTDDLVVSYMQNVKKRIPNLTETELRFLEEQMERVSRGEDRWLGTEEEFDILENIFKKYANAKGRDKDYAWRAENFERTRIPFEKQEITDLEKILLKGWYKYGMALLGNPDNQADFANLFDRLGTVLEEDVSLYRCITLRAEGGVNLDHVKFLNTVKEGAIIDNTGRYTSTASHPNGALNYGTTFGQSYTLKINVPSGTKILDMTHCTDYMIDEYILPKDANYKVIKIDYETGIVECDLILPKTEVEVPEIKIETPEVKVDGDISVRLASANSRKDFAAIRDEINKMPYGAEKTALYELYLQRYNEWSRDPARPDVRMQYNQGKTDLPAIEGLVPKFISDAEASSIAKEFGFSNEEIVALKSRTPHFNSLMGLMVILNKFGVDDFNKATLMEDFDEFLSVEHTNYLYYISEENIKHLENKGIDAGSVFDYIYEEVLFYEAKMSNQEFVDELLSMTVTSDNQQIKRFDKSDINDFFEANILCHELTKELLNITINGKYLSVYDIKKIVKANNGNIEFVMELINTKMYDVEDIVRILCAGKKNYKLTRELLKATFNSEGRDVPRFSPSDIEKIIDAFEKNPEMIELLLKETTTNSKGRVVPRFNASEIEEIINAFEKNPERVKLLLKETTTNSEGRVVPRFNGSDIKEIINAFEKNPKLVELLLKETTTDSEGRVVPRFSSGYDIKGIVKASEKNPEMVELLLKETTTDSEGRDVPRFRAYDIEEIVKASEKNPKLVELLVKERMIDSEGHDVPRFGYYEIKSLVKASEKNPKLVELSVKERKIDSEGRDVPRFRAYDIEEIVNASEKNPELVELLVKETTTNSRGRVVPRFECYEISLLLKASEKNPEMVEPLLKERKIDSEGRDVPRFGCYGITLLVKASEKNPKLVELIVKERKIDSEGRDVPRFSTFDIEKIVKASEKNPEMVELLVKERMIDSEGRDVPRFDGSDIEEIVKASEKNPKLVELLVKERMIDSKGCDVPRFDASKIRYIIATCAKQLPFLKDRDLCLLLDNVNLQYQKVLESPEKYINGEYASEAKMIDAVNIYFEYNADSLMVFSAIFDKEAFNHLLRMRFDDVDDYINIIKNFEASDLELLAQMKDAVNQDGKPFMPTQKVEFIDLLQAYKANDLDLAPIRQMTEAGQVDLGRLQINLFNQIMKNSGLSDAEIASIPKEKLISWDTKFVHLLSKEIQKSENTVFNDILRAGNLEPDFMKYIHDSENVYGQANARTKTIFAEKGLNYEAWIHPSKDAEIRFTLRDKNTERLSQIADQIIEDIEALRQGPVKSFIDKQFPHSIKDGKFVIPTEAMGSKAKLNEFVENIIKQLDSVWKRAQGNATNPDPKRSQMARGTLTILDHLNQRIKDISQVSDEKATKSLDWTIKMWDRDPQKDIFQGNYSTCCIGMGGGNGSAMPHFVMNTAYNMIELVDNNTGKTVGNALCYLVTDESGKPAFIIDNIEINNGSKPSSEIGAQLRDMMAGYASRISKDITGNENIPVYMSGSYNDVPVLDLARHAETVSFIGDIDCDEIYMDLYQGWVSKKNFTECCCLLKLK